MTIILIGLLFQLSIICAIPTGADEPRADLTPHVEINAPLDHNLTGKVYYDNEPIFFDGRGSSNPTGGYLGSVWNFDRRTQYPVYDKLTFNRSFKDPGWCTISLNVSNSLYLTNETSVTIKIVHKNRPPRHDIPEQQMAIEDEPKTLDFSTHVWDLDSEHGDLFLTVESPYATADVLNLTVLFPNGVLEHDLWFNISDGLNETEAMVHFTVTPVDDPPEIADLGEFTAVEEQLSVFNLTPFLSDVDTPVEQLGIQVRETNCTLEGQALHLFHTKGGVTYSISIEVADSHSRVTADLIVHVEEVNDPPVITDLLPRTLIEDMVETIDLSSNISDEETPLDQLVLECTHPSVLAIEGLTLKMLYSTWEEDHTVDFSVFDGTVRTSGSFVVHVQAVNDPPEHDIPEQQTATAEESRTMDFSAHVWDNDNELSELFLTVDSPYATAEGLVLTVLFPEGILEKDLWIGISDGVNTTEVKLHFSITPVDHPPEISGLNLEAGQRVRDVISIEGTASDDGTVETVQTRIDGGEWSDVEGTDSWTLEMDTTTLTHGTHTLDLRGWDGQQWSDPVSVEFFVDQVPDVTVVAPEPLAKIKTTFVASGTASDDAEVVRVEFRIDDGEWKVANGTQEWNHDVGVDDLEEGNHTLQFRSFDGEQYSDMSSVTFLVEKEKVKEKEKPDDSPAIGLVGVLVSIGMIAIVLRGLKKD
jgi:hypothetical protein